MRGRRSIRQRYNHRRTVCGVNISSVSGLEKGKSMRIRWVFFWTRRAHKNDMLDREQMKAILKAAAHAKIPKDGVIKGRKEKHQK